MCFKGRLHIAHFYSRLFSLRKIKSLAALVLDTHPLLLMHPGGHKNSPEWVLRKIQSVCERVMSRKNGWKERMSQQWLVEKDGNCLSVIFKFNCTRNWGWRVGGKAGQICSAWSIVSLFSHWLRPPSCSACLSPLVGTPAPSACPRRPSVVPGEHWATSVAT